MNLEEYLRKGLSNGIIDHSLRVTEGKDGRIEFYMHPDGRDGDTVDFGVEGNLLCAPLHVGDLVKVEGRRGKFVVKLFFTDLDERLYVLLDVLPSKQKEGTAFSCSIEVVVKA